MLKYTLIITLIISVLSCTNNDTDIVIGFSAPYIDDNSRWGNVMYDEIKNELFLHPNYNINLITKESTNKIEQQRRDLLDLYYKDKVDVIIVFTTHDSLLVPTIEELYDKGVSIIILDRKVKTDKFSCFIGYENYDFGVAAGKYAINKLKNKGTVLEITGSKGSSTAKERSEGFQHEIKAYPGIKVECQIDGKWKDRVVSHAIDSLFKLNKFPDLIFAHNDNMALSALAVCEKYNQRPYIIGIDGLFSSGGGVELVKEGKIDVTFFNRPGGGQTIKTAIDLVNGKDVDKIIHLSTFSIDKYNVDAINEGFKYVHGQLSNLEKLNGQVQNLSGTIRYQQLIIYLSSGLILLFAAITAIVLRFLKQKNRLVKKIEEQNRNIELRVKEETALTEQLSANNKLLTGKREEIMGKNKALENYRNNLEDIVQERTHELNIALKKAKESDNLKASFISNLSHELRTPINAILGFSEILFDESFTREKRKGFHKIIVDKSFELIKIIEDILEISKLDEGLVRVKVKEIKLPELFDSFKERFNAQHEKLINSNRGNIDFLIQIPPPINIISDQIRIMQVLHQLTNNAFKYTHNGHIRIGVEVKDNPDELVFYVEDTGIGIDKEFHSVIFDKFRKIEDDKAVLYRGNGIGLSIAKESVSLLGGKIWLESELSGGTRFYFSIPYVKASDKALVNEQSRVPLSLEDKVILIVEDEEANYLLLETILSKHNAIVYWSQDGEEALDLFKVHPEIDVVLMDIELPKMDGIATMKRLREINPDIPVIAVTAYAENSQRDKFLQEGFNYYVSKPISVSYLIKKIKRVLA